MRPSNCGGRGIDKYVFARFSITQTNQSHIWHFSHTHVIHLQSHHVMATVRNGQLLLEVLLVIKVAQQEDCSAFLNGICHKLYCASDVSLAAFRLEGEQFAYDEQDVLAALFRWNEFLHMVAEKDNTYLVIVLNG